MDDEVDPLALRVAARSGHKSLGRFRRLVGSSLALVWRSGRRLFVLLVLLQLLAAGAMAAQVLAVQAVLEAILAEGGPRGMLAPVLLLAGLSACSMVAVVAQGQVQRLLGEEVSRAMWQQVLAVATGVGLRHFESADFHNRLNRVQTNALVRPYQVTQGLLSMAGALAAAIGVGAALVSVSPWLLPLVAVGGVPVWLTSRRESRLEFDFAVGQSEAVRLRQYFSVLQTRREEAGEVRAFGLSPWLMRRFDETYRSYVDALRSHVRRRTLLAIVGQVGAALVLAGTLMVLVWLVAAGHIGVAGAGAAIVAIRMLATQVQALFKGVQTIFESGLFLDDLHSFLELGRSELEQRSGVPAPDGFSEVRAEGLVFRYPGADRDALARVDLSLAAGEVVALVGENGSGKTTLAKLLAGLYEPDEGEIVWDGKDISGFDPTSLRERISVVFQDFARYALTAAENIAVGNISAQPTQEGVETAARSAGAHDMLTGLSNGYDTVLSRMFRGGRELSGGQWQRIALARSFYRDSPLVILDEPTSSLDPRAEYELFSTLRSALAGRTALFISHRFSTVRGADRIYVMDRGQIIEQGTHEELMRRGGRYAELYALQADAYVTGRPGQAIPTPE